MSANQNPPKRPRLSLQIKAISSGPNLRASRTIAAVVNPTSPTSFNTLSNVYATAIDRSTPITAINTKRPLKIQTQNLSQNPHGAVTPFVSTYPETPLTAQPLSPATARLQDFRFPSTMTATPPLSAGPADGSEPRPFSFGPADAADLALPPTTTDASHPAWATVGGARGGGGGGGGRRATAPVVTAHRPGAAAPPYTRNRSLHSILRNSPLPPPTARTPVSPRRQSQRLAEKAARRVGYESPIERVIVTNQYVHSHIDLLLSAGGEGEGGGASPSSPSSSSPSPSTAVLSSSDPILGLAGDDTRDGGMTPGPFEEMRRRMAGLATRTPTSPVGGGPGSPAGVRKRRKRESRRRWVWTIGTSEEEEGEGEGEGEGGPTVVVQSPMDVAAPSIETVEDADVVMAGSEPEPGVAAGRGYVPGPALGGDMDVDSMATPTVAGGARGQLVGPAAAPLRSVRQDSEGLFNPETGSRRDTPVPADLVPAE